jgi:hypothetical protein
MVQSQPQMRPRMAAPHAQPVAASSGGQLVLLAFSWVAMGLPLAWGVYETLQKTAALFK